MKTFVWMTVAVSLGVCAFSTGAQAALRDGKRFDPAVAMTEPAAGAPPEIARMAWALGYWSVDYTRHLDGDSTWTANGRADITFMNRGHNLMERFHCDDFDGQGHALDTITFIVYNATLKTWGMGVADDWRECVVVYSGGFDGDDLVLRNARRPSGGLNLVYYRATLARRDDDAFTTRIDTSPDGTAWEPWLRLDYRRMDAADGLFTTAQDYGEPAPGLPEEARQFDFLIGEWDLSHHMTFPNGREAKWKANGTAVYMLDGHCVMEYSFYDVDPNLPDAATTIVRLWNRQMRRWECMYVTNRFNSILHFGGVKEGDRIVLHKFDADASDVPINQWTFHSWTPDSYGWYGNTSRDRGATWKKTWIIEGTRKE